jgi:hypothetical protein
MVKLLADDIVHFVVTESNAIPSEIVDAAAETIAAARLVEL